MPTLPRPRPIAFPCTNGHSARRESPDPAAIIIIDPEFASQLPRSPDEDARLLARLLVEGCRDALIVWNGRGILVDGHRRFEFCTEHGIPYRVIEMEFADRQAVTDFIWELHYARRNFSPEMKSYARGRQLLALQLHRGGDRKSERSKSHSETLIQEAERLAKQYRVSRATIFRDSRFAAALDRLVEVCGDEIRQGILNRSLKWTRGDVERLAKLPPDEQKRVVAEALAAGKRPKLPPVGGRKTRLVNLPIGRSTEQANILDRLFGRPAARELGKALLALQ
jgi:hypothetical protein